MAESPTLISVKQQSQYSTANVSATSRTASEIYVVRYTGIVSSVKAASAAGLPAIGAAHPDDAGLRVLSRDAKPISEDTRREFQVTVNYGTGTVLENPLTAAAEVTWSFGDEKVTIFKDCSDPPKLIVTTAGEPFENLMEQETGHLTAEIVKNVAHNGFNPATWIPFMQPKAVNSDSVTIDGVTFTAGQVKFGNVTCGPVQESNGIKYRQLTIKLDLQSSWDQVVESRGFNEVGDGGKLKEIIKGEPAVKPEYPWPLDADGAAKANADDPPAEITFTPQPPQAYSAISSFFA